MFSSSSLTGTTGAIALLYAVVPYVIVIDIIDTVTHTQKVNVGPTEDLVENVEVSLPDWMPRNSRLKLNKQN